MAADRHSSHNAVSTKAAGIVGLAVMCSRILGLIREQIFAALFGGGRAMDAFTVAFRTPNLLRDLFAEGALSTAFITTFSKTIATEGDGAAWRLANKVATMTAVVLSSLCLIGILIAPLLVALFAPGFDADKAHLTVVLARIMYPFILLVSLAALVMGMLNAKHVFAVPAMASSFFNLGSIAGGVLIGRWLDPHFGPGALVGLAIGTLIGGALQLAVQLPSLAKLGYVFQADFHWRDAGVTKILRLMGPAVIAASSVQLNVLINSMFASTLGDGPIFWLAIAFRLMQLPLGIFGVALATVTLPVLSRLVAAGDSVRFRSELARGLRLAFLLTIPATIGLIILAEPIISVLYQHGKFNAYQTVQAAGALRFYAIGLTAYSAMKVLVPAFYALDRRKTPMIVSFIAVGMNLAFNWLFTFRLGWGHRGLALSTGCVALTNFLLLYALMRRHVRYLHTGLLATMLAKVLLAGVALGAVCFAGEHWLLAQWATQATGAKAASLLATIGVAGGVFFAVAALLRIDEVTQVATLVRQRLARRPPHS
ncbi:MAG TPA: murein biosynthesis integral membrane protein MurJ [Steroidobacteraceae bacterium]|jgi:putative peptidoglycan lipid II flippase|nr:murein biosynthesis integral membrane protein MurJ [Steroidobacteraceae bacterium]